MLFSTRPIQCVGCVVNNTVNGENTCFLNGYTLLAYVYQTVAEELHPSSGNTAWKIISQWNLHCWRVIYEHVEQVKGKMVVLHCDLLAWSILSLIFTFLCGNFFYFFSSIFVNCLY